VGQKTFSIELVEQVESAERVYELEQYYIKQYDTKVPNGYNLTDGGDGISGLKHNDETKEKIKYRIFKLCIIFVIYKELL
jgi:hypothetical protein